jgi:hypothetical protein
MIIRGCLFRHPFLVMTRKNDPEIDIKKSFGCVE